VAGSAVVEELKMKIRVAIALAGTLIAAAGAQAHHSFTATYDENATIRIEGELVQFMFRNPHAWVHVMAPDENGDMQRWGVEWGGAGQLAGQGVSRDSLKPGDHVIIEGNPGRNAADHRLRMRSLLRPEDGFGWGFEGETFE
jgi:thiamine monophosphate kinase